MPNWVPQSPTWFCRITSSPRNSSTRPTASPMMVERKCPTCISLAGSAREVDHHTPLGARLVHRKLRIGQRGFEALGQGVAVLEEVEKARTGDLDLADLRVLGQCGDELLGQLPRLHAGRFGQHHGDVAGEVAVTLVLVFSTWIAGVSPPAARPRWSGGQGLAGSGGECCLSWSARSAGSARKPGIIGA